LSNLKIYLKAILIPLIVGLVIGLLTSGSMADFNLLVKPRFAPPGILFPIVWTILYTLMGISYGILDSNNLVDSKISSIYYWQLFVNALWSIIFFILKWRLFAFFWIILLIVLVVTMIKRFYEKNKTAGLLQIPYLLWILFAAILNLSIYLLNR
jgi:tryptophan-rich sensory protein